MLELEKEYWNFQKELDLFEYIIPLNLTEEKDKFISNLKRGSIYNPIFQYKKISYDRNDALLRLKKYEKKFRKYSNPISPFYLELIREDIEWINNFCERDTHRFCDWLSKLYGKPEDSFYTQALDKIKSLRLENHNETQISAIKMKERIINKLKEKNINGWNIRVKDSSSRISVATITKTITIKENAYFSFSEIDRLMVHEIGTHVLRYENGRKQKYILFKKGFPNYLKTEEGLAILSEEKNNVLSQKDLVKYCARLIASYLCFNSDFCDLFKVVNNYLNIDDSFDIVARVKRGLINTEQFGGFTKDQIYFRGYLEVKYLPLDKMRKLFLGKIGIEHLDIIDQLENINFNINLPKWVEK
jgi:uncharacterized protein (TIGR02421 family)